MDNFWKNVYGQLHYWWQAVGIGIVSAVALYIVGNSDWTVRGIVVVAVTALTAYLTRQDHKITDKVVEKAKEDTVQTMNGDNSFKDGN